MSTPEAPSTDPVVAPQIKEGKSRPCVVDFGCAHETNAENEAAPRRGPKGYFQGTRRDFLESCLPDYIAAKKGHCQNFWYGFWSAWWQRYPWKLEDDQEPPKDNPERMARLAAVAPGEEQAKKEVEQRLREVCRLTCSMLNQR